MRHLVLCLLFAAPLATAASAQVAARLDDLRLATVVRIALVDDARTRPIALDVTSRTGDVRIDGDVPAADRRIVAEVAQRVPGVRRVDGLGVVLDTPAGPVVAIPERRPEAVAEPSAAGPVYHTVQRGDTLFSLSRRYETTVDAILALNDRQSTGIRIGQRVRVR